MANRTIATILSLRDQFSNPLARIAQQTGRTTREIRTAQNTIRRFQGQVNESFKNIAVTAGAMVISIGAGAVAMAVKTAEATDRIDELSQQIGMSRKSFQEWEFILAQNGVEVDSLKKTYKTLAVEVMKANTGNKDAKKTFKELGINIKDNSGHLKSQDRLYEDVIKSLQGMDDGVKKTVLAYKLLGKGGGDLKPILNSNANDINRLKKQAHDLGIVLDDKTIDAGAKFADQMEVMKRATNAIGFSIGAELIPKLTQMLTIIQANMPQIRSTINVAIGSITTAFKFLIENLNWLIPVASGALSAIIAYKTITTVIVIIETLTGVIQAVSVAQGIWNALMIANPIGLVVTGIALLVAGLVAVYMNWDKITSATQRAIKAMQEYMSAYKGSGVDLKTSAVKGYDYNSTTGKYTKTPAHSLGTSYFAGGRTSINEGDRGEIVNLPNGSQIIPHDISMKSSRSSNPINISVNIAGNVIGNEAFADQIGHHVTSKLKLALSNS